MTSLLSHATRFACCVLLCLTIDAAAAAVPTTTTLAISSPAGAGSTVAVGTIVTLTANVAAGGAPAAPGIVTFCDATASRCTDAAVLGTVPLVQKGSSAGTASLRMAFSAGIHKVKAVLAATHGYQGSSSSPVSFSITDIPTTTALQDSAGAGAYNLNVSVAAAAKSAIGPTGTITFADITNGNRSLGSASLGPSTAGQSFVQGASIAFPEENIQDIATGDFNGDGRQDLAFAMFDNNSVLIALGNGDGTFQSLTNYIVNGQSTALALGDFNQDGALDLAVTLSSGNQIEILFGNGDGSFIPGAMVSTGYGPIFASVGDFNEDGIPDLAVANYGGGTLSILLGNGDGNFTAAAAVPAGTPAVLPGIADLNGDGHLDIVVPNYFYGYTVLLGDGNGGFSSRSFAPPAGTYTEYVGLALGDFNGDGIPDAVMEDAEDFLVVLLGNGDGTFTQQPQSIPLSGGPRSMRSADLNGDGKLDIVVASGSWGRVGEIQSELLQLFYSNGDGTFTQAAISDVPSFVDIPAIADFNGDGLPDIAVANSGEATGPVITADIFLDHFSQTASASLSGVCVPGTGTQQVQANYPGDANYQSSSSLPIALTASPVATTVTLTPLPAVVYGGPAMLSASVTATTGVPTGTVTFLVDGAPAGSATLDGSGHASFTTGSLSVGSHSIIASYGASCPWEASTSTALTLQVAKAALSVSVANASRPYGAANPGFTGTVSGLVGSDTVTVTYTTSATMSSPAGAYPITATVGGPEAATYAVTVTPGTLTIHKAASTLTLAGGPDPQLAQSPVSFTAQAFSSTSGVPAGTVTFLDGGTALGTATLDASGRASYTTAGLSVGTHSITATYGGDQNFLASSASAVNETIGDCGLASTGSTSQTVSGGGTATYTFAVTPTTPSILAPVTLAVAGLPASAAFAFSPSTVPAGNGATTVALTITAPMPMTTPPTFPITRAAWLLVLPWGFLWGTCKPRHRWAGLQLLVLASGAILCLSQLSGCGGGKSGVSSPAPGNSAPAAQNYNLVVTASSGGLQRSTGVVLTIQ